MAIFTAGALGVDFSQLDLAPLSAATPASPTPVSVTLSVGGVIMQLLGTGFEFSAAGPPTGGVIQRLIVTADTGPAYEISGLSLSAATFRGWVLAGDNAAAKAGIFSGADSLAGSGAADRLNGYAGNDTVSGGAGGDLITDTSGSNYLRGDEGDDDIVGGVNFDDINGNMGNDTASGGAGDDWVVGGKDNDRLFGDEGGDLVYGNLGDDYCEGGAGNDTIRGGQQNDSLSGGSGADFVSGDRGDDTMTGGAGADMFHSSSDAGVDRVLDFSASEGDLVLLDPGTTYSISEVGGDTVITMNAGQVILLGVSSATLAAGSIVVG